ncbi:MAG TPA: 3-oxoacyl-[acyl-carrier-protein] reductase [Clostridiales bacterium]|nr:3-oxoacyl-[acyl-carrier-protein] reductase [Clostridiales bacterium]
MPKTVIVTGASKGIGKAIALEFAQKGHNIVVNYRGGLPVELLEEMNQLGGSAIGIKADVSKFDEAKSLIASAKEKFGSVDVLVNNAGITCDNLILRMKEEEFDKVIETNLKGAFNMIRHASPVMLKQKSGAIINISSVVGLIGNIGQVNYAASKAGLIGMTKATARELATRGITCNAVAPGFIDTDMTKVLSDTVKNKMLENIPMGHFGNMKDIAEAVYFLSESRYITGQVLNIDGGMVMN